MKSFMDRLGRTKKLKLEPYRRQYYREREKAAIRIQCLVRRVIACQRFEVMMRIQRSKRIVLALVTR